MRFTATPSLVVSNAGVFHIGAYRLDPARRELWRGDTPIALTPQVFDCLTYLVEHRDRAVGRDELIAAVWGRADVNDTLLGQTIMHARRAVGDNGTEQHAIRTIPRYGYRWIDEGVRVGTAAPTDTAPPPLEHALSAPPSAPVDVSPEAEDPVLPAPTPAGRARASGLRVHWRRFAAAGLALLLCLVALTHLHRSDAPSSVPDGLRLPANPQLVLVVPARIAPGSDTAWVPLGIMDSIAGQLRDRGWPVVPSATAVALGGQPGQDHGVLANASGAGLIVRPQVEHDAGSWHVRLDLHGRKDLPPHIDASAAVLLDAARLAGERLHAALTQQPLPQLAQGDPDFAASQLVQQVEAEMLAGRLVEAGNLIASTPETLRERPEVRLQAATLDYRAGRLEQSATALRALLHELPPESPPQWRARTLIGLGSIARTRARFADALPYYEQAIAVLEPLNQPDLSGIAHAYLGISLSGLGRFDEAMAALSRARVLLESVGDAYGIAQVDSTYAAALADRRRLAEAAPRLQQAIGRFDQLGMKSEAQAQRLALAQVYRELLEHDAALAASGQGWDFYRQHPSDRLYPIAAATRIWALTEAGRLLEAGQVVGAVQRNLDRLDHGYQWDQLRLAIADLQRQNGQWSAAESGYADVIDVAALPEESGLAWLSWLRALRALDRGEQAQAGFARAAQWASTVDGQGDRLVYARLIEAEQEWSEGQRPQARAHYAEALSLAEKQGAPALIARVAVAYGRALIGESRLGEAASVVGRVAAWADRDYDCALLQAEFYRAAGDHPSWQRALARARTLAGERVLPQRLTAPEPVPAL